jgi:GNAT superfamily N-acetyltransferase
MITITIAKTMAELRACYQILIQLRPELSESDFIELAQYQQINCYQLAYLNADNQVKAIAGFHIGQSFGWQTYLYVDDLVTDTASRSQGYGTMLITWLKDYARENNCTQIHLDSCVTRHSARKVYLDQEIIANHYFLIDLNQTNPNHKHRIEHDSRTTYCNATHPN